MAHLFGNLKLKPAYSRFKQWKNSVGEDGIAVAQGLGIACSSPMHFIQKTLLDATDFYLHYHDYPIEMAELAEALEPIYEELIEILAGSPADALLWSGNVDDMITYNTRSSGVNHLPSFDLKISGSQLLRRFRKFTSL